MQKAFYFYHPPPIQSTLVQRGTPSDEFHLPGKEEQENLRKFITAVDICSLCYWGAPQSSPTLKPANGAAWHPHCCISSLALGLAAAVRPASRGPTGCCASPSEIENATAPHHLWDRSCCCSLCPSSGILSFGFDLPSLAVLLKLLLSGPPPGS